MRDVDHIVRISSSDLWARREPEAGAVPALLAGAAFEPVAPAPPRPPDTPPAPLPAVALLAVEVAVVVFPNKLGAAALAAGALLVVDGAEPKRLGLGAVVPAADVPVDAGAVPPRAPKSDLGALAAVVAGAGLLKRLDVGAAVPGVEADVVAFAPKRLPPSVGAAVPEAGALLVVCGVAVAGALLVFVVDAEGNMLGNGEAAVEAGGAVLVVA